VIAVSDAHPTRRLILGEEPRPAEPGSWDIQITPTILYTRLEDACAAEFPRLVRLLTLFCGDRETALDLAQETCARGCAKWSSVKNMQDQRARFTKVALNLARSRWRRRAVERRVLALLGSRLTANEQHDVAEAITVQAAIARLNPRQRAAVVLRYLDDLDLTTTAAAMRCSEGTVKKLTARGLATLRTLLEFELDRHGGGNG
jgi:RNA polymerase sigma factor (sigma-70 family)